MSSFLAMKALAASMRSALMNSSISTACCEWKNARVSFRFRSRARYQLSRARGKDMWWFTSLVLFSRVLSRAQK